MLKVFPNCSTYLPILVAQPSTDDKCNDGDDGGVEGVAVVRDWLEHRRCGGGNGDGKTNNSLLELHLSKNYDMEKVTSSIEELPKDLGQMECLEKLDLSHTHVKHLPGSICKLKHLKTLFLSYCDFLEKLPDDVGQLESLEILDLTKCSKLKDIPSSICKLKHLKELQLIGCMRLKKLPNHMGDLQCLQLLNIKDSGITHLPPLKKNIPRRGQSGIKKAILFSIISDFQPRKKWHIVREILKAENIRHVIASV
ncbi:hypothetical protein R6Q59_002275 [Mikania micrantha]